MRHNVDPRCIACGQIESISHCLWERRKAVAIWGRALRLLCHASSSFTLNMGHACGNCLEDDVAKYDSTCNAKYIGENGTVRLITDNRVPTTYAHNQKLGDLWTLLALITIWCIWTTSCTKVFSAHKHPPVESIKLIWHTLITTLRAQYERIDGTNDVAELMRLNFRKRRCTTPMTTTNGMDILWKYEVPRWLFPPPISWTRSVKEISCGIVNVGEVYERMARDTCESV